VTKKRVKVEIEDELSRAKSDLAKAEAVAKESRKLRADDLVTTVRMHRRAMAAEAALQTVRDGALSVLKARRAGVEIAYLADQWIVECEKFLAHLSATDIQELPDPHDQNEQDKTEQDNERDKTEQDKIDPRDTEIDRLHEQLDRLDAERGRLTHECDEVKAALRPFAILGRMLRSTSYPDGADIWGYNDALLTVGDFRRASNVLLTED
jgi:hypothetical protein